MSDTLQPGADASPNPAPLPAAGPKRVSVKLRLISFAVGLSGLVLMLLVGFPSATRLKRAPPRTAQVNFSPAGDISGALAAGFADLVEPVDPVTRQRPAYPTTAELETRLAAVGGWEMAVLFALDATPAELHAGGVEDPDVCMALNRSPMSESFPQLRHWKLVLLDAQQRIMGSALFEVPTLDVERFAGGDSAADQGPVLERRFPDWPRAQVFTRQAAGAQSDG